MYNQDFFESLQFGCCLVFEKEPFLVRPPRFDATSIPSIDTSRAVGALSQVCVSASRRYARTTPHSGESATPPR